MGDTGQSNQMSGRAAKLQGGATVYERLTDEALRGGGGKRQKAATDGMIAGRRAR